MSRLAALLVCVCACGGAPPVERRPGQQPPASIAIGDCADPAKDGVVGERPRIERHDRDLDSDKVDEPISLDRALCTAEGNCFWNVFAGRAEGGCHRYLGTIEAAGIEWLGDRGESGYHDLRAWWRFGGPRSLVQQYRFRAGGYQVVDALICSRQDDDRILCAEDRPSMQ